MKRKCLIVIYIFFIITNCFCQFKNSTYIKTDSVPFPDKAHISILVFYSDSEGIMIQKFKDEMNIIDEFNHYVTFFNYEVKNKNKPKYILLYPQKHYDNDYYILPKCAFDSSEYMNKIAHRALNDPPRKYHEFIGWFYNLPDTCKLEIVDKNTLAQVLPGGPMERQLGFVWIYRKK